MSMAQIATRKALTLAGADMVAQAAEAAALARGARVVIAVVDESGKPIVLRRLDGAQVASVDVAMDKARTAAVFRRPSKELEDQVRDGRFGALQLAGGVTLQGGIPLVVDGQAVGAIGVSGASSADEDQELATIGAAVPLTEDGAEPPAVFHLDAEAVAAKFRTGGLLLDAEPYKIDAGRRTGPGEVEFHAWVTDIMYVLDGEATVVTGGEMLEPRQVGPGEYRAPATRGGTTQHLAKGDVMVIPAGVPHRFTEVPGPLSYYVVKVVQPH